jgi:hypothetical protein
MAMTPVDDDQNSVLFWAGLGLLKSKNLLRDCVLMTTLMTGLMLMNYEAAAQQPPATRASGLTCNMNGITPQERGRYGHLVEALRHALQERRELPDGYAFQMNIKQIGTNQLAEWIELERKCCPFFGFEIRWTPQNGAVWLHLSGPEGVKEFILQEFGLR